LTVNILLIAIIYISANVGSLFGIKGMPLQISPVWPATGFSLASLLLFGFSTWPGIFLGNFIYNFSNLFLTSDSFTAPLATAIAVSFGSLAQGLAAAFLMRRFSSVDYLTKVKDVFIFLVPAGAMSCLISSIIGATALHIYDPVHIRDPFVLWITFWIGDTMGVYIFTSPIIVWALQKPAIKIQEYPLETFLMAFLIFITILLTFIFEYPLSQFLFLLSIWVTYRFRMHGATLTILFLAFAALIPTVLGYGAFYVYVFDKINPLILLVSFFEVLVFSSLILAAVINERAAAWLTIHDYNEHLQEEVAVKKSEIKEMRNEIFTQEKLASLSLLTSNLSKNIAPPLQMIESLTNSSMDRLQKIRGSYETRKEKINKESRQEILDHINTMDSCLKKISKFNDQAVKIFDYIQKQMDSSKQTVVKSINVHTILNNCTELLLKEKIKKYPEFNLTIVKDFDKEISMINALPDDLSQAFMQFLSNATFSMREKKEKLGINYVPLLTIQTKNQPNFIMIIIKDNGLGISKKHKKDFFQSWISTNPPEEASGVGLSLAHDIIVHVHRGDIKMESQKGEYLQLTITLPKDHQREPGANS
jgi:integral membrane sensor domain MASE1